MDWSAIFAGIAALTAIAGLIYSIRQHRNNVRNEFLLWAIERLDASDQREGRGLVFILGKDEEKKQELIERIEKGELYGEDYNKIRSVFTLFNQIGYFWLRFGYGKREDALTLFPQIIRIWEIGKPIINAIRSRPGQSASFVYFERLARKLSHLHR